MTKEEDQALLRKYRKRSPWVMIVIVLLLVVAALGLAAVIYGPTFLNNTKGSAAEHAQAKAAFRKVIAAAETYRQGHDNVYEEITAAKIQSSAGSIKVVDGYPKVGEVGISDYNSKRLVLMYLGKSGQEYVATVESGTVEYDF